MRKLRFDYPDPVYHVINRGNYRAWVFRCRPIAGRSGDEVIQSVAAPFDRGCEVRFPKTDPKGSRLTFYLERSDGVRYGSAVVRKLRFEYPGPVPHVINRGNHRGWGFREAQEKAATEACLFDACRCDPWALAPFVVMGNHDHVEGGGAGGPESDERWLGWLVRGAARPPT